MGVIPNQLKLKMAEAFFNSGDFKIALFTSSLVPDVDAHNFYGDLDNEVTGTNYVAGGDDLPAPSSITKDNDNDWVTVDWDDYTFENVTIAEIRYVAIYKNTGDPATSPVVAILDFGSNQAVSANNFIVNFAAEGAVRVA